MNLEEIEHGLSLLKREERSLGELRKITTDPYPVVKKFFDNKRVNTVFIKMEVDKKYIYFLYNHNWYEVNLYRWFYEDAYLFEVITDDIIREMVERYKEGSYKKLKVYSEKIKRSESPYMITEDMNRIVWNNLVYKDEKEKYAKEVEDTLNTFEKMLDPTYKNTLLMNNLFGQLFD